MKINKNLILIGFAISLAFILSIIATFFGKTGLSSYQETKNSTNFPVYRLPRNLKPFLYEIYFKIGHDSFSGRVNISFVCLNPTNRIVLNVKDLLILNETIDIHSQNETVFFNKNWLYDNQAETMTIFLYRYCQKNVCYSLAIEFSGNISENIAGFYRSSYNTDLNLSNN